MKISNLLAAVALSLSASSVLAAEDFTVDETVYGGSGSVTAQIINGGYAEVITFDGLGGFEAAAYATFSLFYNEGNPTPLSADLGTEYFLYAVFYASGTVGTPAPGIFSFDADDASFSLFADPNKDTTGTLPATGSGVVTVAGNGDDDQLASSSNLTSGVGLLVAGTGGFFDLVFDDFTLTPAGSLYFVQPMPFHMIVNVDGDLNSFTVAGTQLVNGDVSAVFASVPEPSVLALFASGLLGLGFAARRRRRS